MPETAGETLLAEARVLTDRELGSIGERLEREYPGPIGEGLRYALGTSGKRIRPALVVASYRAAGGTHPAIGRLAAAVEVMHTYSLVHDDLPCMDDAAERRGRPTVHTVFDVPTATWVGYLLVPVAIGELNRSTEELGLDREIRARIARVLLEASGIAGMVGGQWLDLQAEGRSLGEDDLTAIHASKTGALIEACCVVGALAATASPAVVEALAGYGREIGLAFQVADDVLDATATTAQLGKTAGRDASMAKSTYVSFLGVPGAQREAARLAARAVECLTAGGMAAPPLVGLARYIVSRSS